MIGSGRRSAVLVTGFCDWQRITTDGAAPKDPWRCEHNPSGRLLCSPRPEREPPGGPFDGPLVRALAAQPGIAPRYALLPVRWGVALGLRPASPDERWVHLGLGVYDDVRALQLEWGAWPWRAGSDVDGLEMDAPLGGGVLDDDRRGSEPREGTPPMASLAAGLDGARFGAMHLRVAAARPDNVFLCNETHWHALGALARGELRGAWFVHIPDAPLEPLARALAALILRLVAVDVDATGSTR